MSKKKKKTDKSEKKAKVHEDLKGFEIKINPLGEITSSYSIDQLNEFLDKNVYDKKLPDLGLEKPGGTTASKDKDDDNYHVEETQEEEESPDEILKKPTGKLKPTRKRKPSDDEDDDEDGIDAEDEDED